MDYRDFNKADPNEKKDPVKVPKPKVMPRSNRWWLAKGKMLPSAIMSQVGQIIQADRGRIDSYNTYARLYGTYTPTFWNGYALANSGRPTAPARDRLTYNLVQSCVDTLVSLITENQPKPMFLTSGGNSRVQRRAQKLDAYCYGTFYQNKVYELMPLIFRDCCVFGEGIVHVYVQGGKLKYERVLPYELLVDYLESHYGPQSTRTLHRIKNIDRTELAEMFPEFKAEISLMSGTAHFISANQRSVGDTVTVVESWRLPVGDQPGLHTISAADFTFLEEDYKHDFFPFAIMRYSPRLYGFYAQSLAEQLVPIQVEINRTLISIQRSLYLGGTHKIFVKAGSKIIKSHFDNLIGTILEYAGDTPPQYVVPQLVQPEIYNHLNEMIGRGYNLPGISQMGATSVKTPGVNSGRAMRTEQNINTQRHNTVNKMYQHVFIDLARISVAVAKDHYENGGELKSVNVPGKRFIQTIDWKECDLEEDSFVLQLYPVSKLPSDPEGRIATITEMMESGLIDPQVGRRVLDFPDLEAEEKLANASQDYLHKILDDIVDGKGYTAPEPDDNHLVAKKLVLQYIAEGKLNELPDDRMEKLRTFNKQVDAFLAPEPEVPEEPQAGIPIPEQNPEPVVPMAERLSPDLPQAVPV
jgi:hypothetical protein